MSNASRVGARDDRGSDAEGDVMAEYVTRFASLDDFTKGSLEIIDDDPKSYTYSNMFEVASNATPWEQIAVAKNMEYVLAAVRAEGTSGWRICSHDEFAILMDGEVEFRFLKPDDTSIVPADDKEGSVGLDAEPAGTRMGTVRARRGHMTLLPAGAAYQMQADRPGVLLIQGIEGEDTLYRWAEICQTIA
jgi:hypothetical protein